MKRFWITMTLFTLIPVGLVLAQSIQELQPDVLRSLGNCTALLDYERLKNQQLQQESQAQKLEIRDLKAELNKLKQTEPAK